MSQVGPLVWTLPSPCRRNQLTGQVILNENCYVGVQRFRAHDWPSKHSCCQRKHIDQCMRHFDIEDFPEPRDPILTQDYYNHRDRSEISSKTRFSPDFIIHLHFPRVLFSQRTNPAPGKTESTKQPWIVSFVRDNQGRILFYSPTLETIFAYFALNVVLGMTRFGLAILGVMVSIGDRCSGTTIVSN